MKDIIRHDIIELENFFCDTDLERFNISAAKFGAGFDSVVKHGPFADHKIANYVDLITDIDLVSALTARFQDLMGNATIISTLAKVTLFFPWDIHADFYLDRCTLGYTPYYNFLAPLEDVESRTIIFHQTTQGPNDFHTYKQNNEKTDYPVDPEFWQENLSMCWEEDREYVSLQHVMKHQRKGQLLGFPRKFFHSSDNFHLRGIQSKSFLQIRIDRPA